MGTFNGIGTMYYGKADYDEQDRSYTATKWFVFWYIPLIPIRSYRLREVSIKYEGIPFVLWSAKQQYQIFNEMSLMRNWKQVVRVYATEIAVIGLLFGIPITLGKMGPQPSIKVVPKLVAEKPHAAPGPYPCFTLRSEAICNSEVECRWNAKACKNTREESAGP